MSIRHVLYTQEPGIDGTGITTIEKEQLVLDVSDVSTRTAAVQVATNVLSALRFDAEHPNYGAVRGTGVSGAQRTANRVAIQLAADDARDTGGTLVLKGTYEIDGTVTIASHVDASSATLIVYDTSINPVIRLGNGNAGQVVLDKFVELPTVVQAGKTNGTGWSGSDVGVEVCNLYHSHVFLGRITNFSTNFKVAANGAGNVHNAYYISHLQNGKINLDIRPNASGWCNSNTYIGGRLSHHPSEGTNVSGTRHVMMANSPNQCNTNRFLMVSVESDTAEYHVECFGHNNVFDQMRWEATAPKMRFNGTAAANNIVFYGYESQNVQVLEDNGAVNNHRYYRDGLRIHTGAGTKGVFIGSNRSSGSYPVFVVLDSTAGQNTDSATGFRWAVSAQFMQFKAATDASPRFQITNGSGRMDWGNGTNAVDTTLERKTTNVLGTGADDGFRTGTVATGSRPTAASAGAGTQLYDTTLKKPIWSDGSAWRDAAGTVV